MLLKNCGQEKKNDYTTEQLLDENLKNVDGESNIAVRARMYDCLNEILEKYRGQNIAIVSHGGAIKYLLMKWCKYDYESNSFYLNDKMICSVKLESPSALKLVFENDKLIEIIKIV